MRQCLDQIGVITAIGVSAILGWFEFALPDSSYGTMVASPTGQPVMLGHHRPGEEGHNCSDGE
jgi:hypothetical protein